MEQRNSRDNDRDDKRDNARDNGRSVRVSEWNGHWREDWEWDGRAAIAVLPDRSAPGKPWVWRTEFFDAFAYADMALLELGWPIVYCRLSDMFGSPEAVERMERFRRHIVRTYGFSGKPVLFGFSRGGMYALNYAARYPDHAAALYLDAPVLDLLSWPGGTGEGAGAPEQWRNCLAVYGLTEETAGWFRRQSQEAMERVTQADIPLLIVAGDADRSVPFAENAALLAERYRQSGGTLELIVKPGGGHHPHSLADPAPIVRFIQQHARLD